MVHRLTGIPFSFTAHANDIYVDQHMLREKVRADLWWAIPEYNKELIVRHAGADTRAKVQVVHRGVDTRLFQPRQSVASGAPFTIVCVGSLEEGPDLPARGICQILKQRGLRFVCHLIGDGQMRPALEGLITPRWPG
ncbi:MAG: hypothetical protein U0Z44_06575 [Kouleothrix sp.]